eukprot:jgi/Mesen1/5222/ME000026S04523
MDAAQTERFRLKDFYKQWSGRETELAKRLRKVVSNSESSREEVHSLVNALVTHIDKYTHERAHAAHENTPEMAAGVWRTPLEAGFVWLGGWRPGAAIMLAYSLMGMQIKDELHALLEGVDVPSMASLSHQQLTQLNELQQEIRARETDLSDRLATLQMMMADEDMTKAAASTTAKEEEEEQEQPPRQGGGGGGARADLAELDGVMDDKLASLRDLLIAADALRQQTLHRMMRILTPGVQAGQYLVAAVELMRAVRKLGVQKNGCEPRANGRHQQSAEQLAELRKAVAHGETELLAHLLEHGADPKEADLEGRSSLHLAAARGHHEVCEMLIIQGADVDHKDVRGRTALLDALEGGHERTSRVLLQYGASINPQEIGQEVCKAAVTGNLEYLRRLVEHSHVDPNIKDFDQRTPLHMAAAAGIYPAVLMLLDAGADVELKDRHGYTALDEARRENRSQIIELLEERRAQYATAASAAAASADADAAGQPKGQVGGSGAAGRDTMNADMLAGLAAQQLQEEPEDMDLGQSSL